MHLIVNWENFLHHHWQNRPVLLRKAISDFINPISPEELEKLVREKVIENQVIQRRHGKCQLVHQAFNGYALLGQRNWSLKVESINHWHRASEEFLSLFRVFPDWVKESLTVFFSVPGGGIGPQTKPSDVLVIQGIGRSRWRVGDRWLWPVGYGQKDFSESIINEELSSGDILYIPKGFPHESMSSETDMSYCLHFWTDNSLRMIRNWTESLSDENHRGIEYSPAPDLLLREDPTEILPQDITALQAMMSQFLLQKREHLENWFTQEMSQTSYELPKAPEAQVYSPSQVQTLLQNGSRLNRLMGLRMLHIGDRYFVNGASLSLDYADAWNILARHKTIEGPLLSHMIQDDDFIAQLTVLINQGYWYFE
ncbi:cupin domain-containing protein [Candidatus Williamhamiltonella defendens]|uniref:cupin domain-containing protein n=1 Tax=Candidatus Williamhamiltonella defendens TaxID=138072 RepID=UPI00130E69BF|nr:cupin domain-containing protein [Candidatus Hamiltonella defensa]